MRKQRWVPGKAESQMYRNEEFPPIPIVYCIYKYIFYCVSEKSGQHIFLTLIVNSVEREALIDAESGYSLIGGTGAQNLENLKTRIFRLLLL
jgi:hypothetical protein